MFHFMNHCQLLKLAQLAPAAGGAFGSYTEISTVYNVYAPAWWNLYQNSDCSQRLWSINPSSEVVTYYKFNPKVHLNFDATFDEKYCQQLL